MSPPSLYNAECLTYKKTILELPLKLKVITYETNPLKAVSKAKTISEITAYKEPWLACYPYVM